ncbi:MAG: 6-carboxytetrahydropterin synthase [Oscillospiraceae bacterium]
MRFKGYKLRLKLNILHSMKSAGNAENPHPHTLSITIFFDAKDEALADFNSAQKEIEIYNLLYLGKNFNKTPPFDIIEPTIENIGDEFYNQYHSILLKKNFILRRLEISETPSRIYAVDYKMTDDVLKKSHDAVTLNLLSEKVKNEFANSPQETQGFPHIKEAPQKMLLPKSTEKLGFFDTKNQMVTSISEKQGHHTTLKFIFAALIILAAALVLMVVVKNTGNYPLGLDIYGHLYKSDLLHDSLNSGNPYPL